MFFNKTFNPNYLKQKILNESEVLEINVSNNTVFFSAFTFFSANNNELIVNTPQVTFSDVSQYNFLTQQLRDSPLIVNAIEIIASNFNQLIIPINVRTKDADGNRLTYHHLPNINIDAYQKSSNISLFIMNHLILDGYTTFSNYILLPNSSIKMLIFYKQFKRSNMFKTGFFPVIKKPLFSNGADISEDIEYENEVSNGFKNISH